MTDGRVVKGIGGFYYVETADAVYECKARGRFKKGKNSLLVGDYVSITINDGTYSTIDEIKPRKNFLIRPPLANIDQIFIVSSIVDPAINTVVLDRLIAIAEFKGIEPVIVLTKIDLDESYKTYFDLYEKAGFKVIACNNMSGDGAKPVAELLKDKTSAFAGNTGVGKSSLINSIDESLSLETGETSKKLGRGKHTTRACSLYRVAGGYVADTPGFSAVDIEKCEVIYKEDLPYCFREFEPYIHECKFNTNCTHITDKGCAVLKALDSGEISKKRHESYVALYNEVKDIKEWEKK